MDEWINKVCDWRLASPTDSQCCYKLNSFSTLNQSHCADREVRSENADVILKAIKNLLFCLGWIHVCCTHPLDTCYCTTICNGTSAVNWPAAIRNPRLWVGLIFCSFSDLPVSLLVSLFVLCDSEENQKEFSAIGWGQIVGLCSVA